MLFAISTSVFLSDTKFYLLHIELYFKINKSKTGFVLLKWGQLCQDAYIAPIEYRKEAMNV